MGTGYLTLADKSPGYCSSAGTESSYPLFPIVLIYGTQALFTRLNRSFDTSYSGREVYAYICQTRISLKGGNQWPN
jgi:hypothetical protein